MYSKKIKVFLSGIVLLSLLNFKFKDDAESKSRIWQNHILRTYNAFDFKDNKLDFEIFKKGLVGFYNLKYKQELANDRYLTIIDFTKNSTQKRLWILDLKKNTIVYNTLVAHGKNTGEGTANSFSNTPESNQSSLGFYVTSNTYFGKHDLSLKLIGKDNGFNHNAFSRAIVMHGADYVSEGFIANHGRLGRSQGCPALPVAVSSEIVNLLQKGSCLFIYANDNKYLSASEWLNEASAMAHFGIGEVVI